MSNDSNDEKSQQFLEQQPEKLSFTNACKKFFKLFKAFLEEHTDSEPSYPRGRGRRYYR